MAAHYQEGRYKFAIQEQAWQRASTGASMLVLAGVPVAQLKDGREVPVDTTYTRHIRVVVLPNTAEMALKKLRNAGFTGSKWSEVNLVGATVEANCSHSEYQGDTKEDWDLALPGGGPLVNDASVAAALDAAIPLTGALAPGAAAAKPSGPVAAKDDIPFAIGPWLLPLAGTLLGLLFGVPA